MCDKCRQLAAAKSAKESARHEKLRAHHAKKRPAKKKPVKKKKPAAKKPAARPAPKTAAEPKPAEPTTAAAQPSADEKPPEPATGAAQPAAGETTPPAGEQTAAQPSAEQKDTPPQPPKEERAADGEVLSLAWGTASAFCGDTVQLQGTTRGFGDGASVQVALRDQTGRTLQTISAQVSGGRLQATWSLQEVVPTRAGSRYDASAEINAEAGGQKTSAPLRARFVVEVPEAPYVSGRSHFHVAVENNTVVIGSELHWVKGWAAEVVRLDDAVPPETGGVIAGLAWPGMRWMKRAGLGRKYWNGEAWVDLPSGFRLADSNNFAVGFYRSGGRFVCQYGGEWPEQFTDWDSNAPAARSKIEQWRQNIDTTWTGQAQLKRTACRSSAPECCRYETKAAVSFDELDSFQRGCLVIAPGNIRSNDSLWFLEESRIAVAAHEFGHHLGNLDEYAGAAVDTSLNSDGAVNGIDPNSIMGQNLTTVKARHYRTICTHLGSMVGNVTGRSTQFEAKC